MVYDQSVQLPSCDWTDAHFDQGFARRESAASFRTLEDFGRADVRVMCGPYSPHASYRRVISTPFLIETGRVVIGGPEETLEERSLQLPAGSYRLTVCQSLVGEELQEIDLYFERLQRPLTRSEVLVQDEGLTPPATLVETARIAGED